MDVTLVARMQKEICSKYKATYVPLQWELKIGISENVRAGLQPLNGLRLHPDQGTTGWFIWAGETLSNAPDFFVALHPHHVEEWCPAALPYLGLAPGWRFLIAPGYVDVWFDEQLLEA